MATPSLGSRFARAPAPAARVSAAGRGHGRRFLHGSIAPALAFLLFAALATVAYGAHVVTHLSAEVVGSAQSPFFSGRDQGMFVWALAWAEHALVHAQNPLLTSELFAPRGFNLAWAPSMLVPGLAMSPLTALAGAVPAFNVLALLAPALAGTAAFLLGRELTGSLAASLACGLLYAFSSYETAEMISHLNLALSAGPPLAVWLAVRRVRGATQRRTYIVALGVLLGAQLWTSTEVLASMVVFGTIAFIVAGILAGDREGRRATVALAGESAAGLAVGVLIGAPLLYYAIRYPNPLSGHPQAGVGADLAGLVIPTNAIWLHGNGHALPAGSTLAGNITEQGMYLGPVLLAALVAFALEFRRTLLGRLLVTMFVVAALAALGSHLFIGGTSTHVWLPWSLAGEMPFIRYAIPARFALYMWLATAAAMSLWLAQRRARALRWAVLGLALVTLVPSPSFRWASRVDRPPLLASPSLARYVPAGATVLALPFGEVGQSMYWQVESGFRFRLAGGYVGWALPAPYAGLSVIRELTGQRPGGDLEARLCRFEALTGTSVALVRSTERGYFPQELGLLHARPRRAGGFLVYDMRSPASAASCRQAIAAAGPTR